MFRNEPKPLRYTLLTVYTALTYSPGAAPAACINFNADAAGNPYAGLSDALGADGGVLAGIPLAGTDTFVSQAGFKRNAGHAAFRGLRANSRVLRSASGFALFSTTKEEIS